MWLPGLLALPLRQVEAALAQRLVQSARQRGHEPIRARRRERPLHRGPIDRSVAGQAQVVLHRPREQEHLLRDQPHVAAQRAQVPLAHRGQDFEAGVLGRQRRLHAHLVVALGGGAVGHSVAALFVGLAHQFLGDDVAPQRRAEEARRA